MKCFIAVILLNCIAVSLISQTYEMLDTNNLSVRINYNGDLFNDHKQLKSNFYAPKSSGKTAIYMSSLWIGAMDQNDDLHLAAQVYRSIGSDFWYGPIGDMWLKDYFGKYKRVFKITKKEIDQFKETGKISNAIKTWPAHGNRQNGEAEMLAPFIDKDHDGKYEPGNGDYPQISGDMAIYFMFNDDRFNHYSEGQKLKVEVHGLAYAFHEPANPALNNTVFVRYKVINRSLNDYFNVRLGLFTDFDLGNSKDDYVGCDSAGSYFFVYNGDSLDEGSSGYGENTPVVGVAMLDEPMYAFMSYSTENNDMNPVKDFEFYHNLSGKWIDNKAVLYGGDGRYNSWGNWETKFMYNHNSVKNAQTWSEKNTGNKPGDRRCLASVKPFSLPAGAQYSFEVAFIFAETADDPDLTLERFSNYVGQVRNFHQSNISSIEQPGKLSLDIYPNPVIDNKIYLRLKDETSGEVDVSLYDTQGKLMFHQILKTDSNLLEIAFPEKLSEGIFFIQVQAYNSYGIKPIIIQ